MNYLKHPMQKNNIRLALFLLVITLPQLLFASELKTYVEKPDPNFAWRVVDSKEDKGVTKYVLHMSSQIWRNAQEVDRVLWRHWLVVYVPNKIKHDSAFLKIGGSKNRYPFPEKENKFLKKLAKKSQSLTAELFHVPNQPLMFLSDESMKIRSEDEVLAYAWAQFLKTSDVEWMAHLPMVKSAVRGMDAIQAFYRENSRTSKTPPTISRFTLMGASKRGWTTWLTAAVDERVSAIAPLVIDVLNIKKSMAHHFDVYGSYSPAIRDYVDNGVMKAIESGAADKSLSIIDPLNYKDKLKLPKLIINSAGDQFFLPDSSHFYFDQLDGAKSIRYLPNTDHSLAPIGYETLTAFYLSHLNGDILPQFSWQSDSAGKLEIKTVTAPVAMRVWSAENPEKRDFRLDVIGEQWKSREIALGKESDGKQHTIAVDPPGKGYKAFFVELDFPNPHVRKQPIQLTTEVYILSANK